MVTEKNQRGIRRWRPHPAFTITLFALASQAVTVLSQVIIAGLLGASREMDAFLIAFTLPQYLGSVIVSSLGFVLIPVFSGFRTSSDERQGWRVVSSVLNTYVLGLGGLVLLGILNRDWLLAHMAPGLSPEVAKTASRLALITWPTIVPTGVAAMLIGIYQTLGRFNWAAFVPLASAVINLGIVLIVGNRFGAEGVAIAAAIGAVSQVLFLAPVVCYRDRYSFSFDWAQPGVRRVSALMAPLVVLNIVAKSSPIVERYLASFMLEGSISQLGYAFRLMALASGLISTGVGTIVFQRMAVQAVGSDTMPLQETITRHLAFMWFVTAPMMLIGFSLCIPFAQVVLERGRFSEYDAVRVGELLRIYLWALAAGGMGTISGRAFYARKETLVPSLIGVVESVLYVAYTFALARALGAAGVAFGYVLFMNGSVVWQLWLLRRRLGPHVLAVMTPKFFRIGGCAALAGAAAWAGAALLPRVPLLQLCVGAATGVAVFIVACRALAIPEFTAVWRILFRSAPAA
jgi:putative peptidoglycan lipid II flippase